MSNPYVYTPAPSSPAYPPSQYMDPNSFNQYSPFIPNSVVGYGPFNGSPYAGTSPLPGTGPLPGTSPNSYVFPGGESATRGVEWTGFEGFNAHQRRPSWHGTPSAGLLSPQFNPGFLTPDPNVDYFRERRHSFSNANAAQPPPWYNMYSPSHMPNPFNLYQTTYTIHPFLNGENPRNDFKFDVSNPHFNPQKLINGPTGPTWVPLTREELVQVATMPPIRQLRMVCDLIPHWPMELRFDANPSFASGEGAKHPVTLYDVLLLIHKSLQQRIGYSDWARLDAMTEAAVTRAYLKRCSSYGHVYEMSARADGVKRIDYLLGKVWFRGVLPSAQELKVLLST